MGVVIVRSRLGYGNGYALVARQDVKVSVASANDYSLVSTTSASSKIAYTLTGADAIAFFAGDYDKSFPLSVSIADAQWQQAASGEHTDVLTFTAEYTNA